MEEHLITLGTMIYSRLGDTANITLTAPLVTSVKQIGLLRVFLTSALVTVVVFLGILSVQLIYFLMLSDVEEKTYQYGMLRALGFRKKSLIALISLQSLAFSGPGLGGGLVVATFLNFIARFAIFQYSRNSVSYDLSPESVILGAILGLVLPLISNVVPIQSALSKNLRISLDLYHRAVNEITVTVKRLENMGMSVT